MVGNNAVGQWDYLGLNKRKQFIVAGAEIAEESEEDTDSQKLLRESGRLFGIPHVDLFYGTSANADLLLAGGSSTHVPTRTYKYGWKELDFPKANFPNGGGGEMIYPREI
jgi:hypothetical protein